MKENITELKMNKPEDLAWSDTKLIYQSGRALEQNRLQLSS